MRKVLLIVALLIAVLQNSSAQTVQGTLLSGSANNRVIIALRASSAFTAPFTNVQFVLQIPNTAAPIPTVSIVNNFVAANIPSYNFSTVNSATPIAFVNEGGYYNYLFSSVVLGGAPFNFTTTTTNILELEITGAPGLANVRFAHLPDGGSTSQHALYIEMAGNDYTDYGALYYGGSAVNGPGGYSGYSYSQLNGVSLPVTFSQYDANCSEKGAMLSWTTVTEQNSNLFEIQRSENGLDWTVIGTVNAAGNSNSSRSYRYLDLKGGAAFYRLRQVDMDGRYTYTEIKRTNCRAGQFDVVLYPVPAKDNITVVINSDKAVRTDLLIVDMNGRTVRRVPTQINSGNNTIQLNVSDLSAGQYLLSGSDPSIELNKKFTVIR
ncbi:MAG: T9SS type A sorting domain-containing protein [Chitinophagaceae bacterium]|nr:T9SS type A sorting domain-containing protein [Chitinophagaceae bacterium]